MHISIVKLLYTLKKKGGKPDRKHTLFGLGNPYRNLSSENSQDYAQKPQQNCMIMNSASGQLSVIVLRVKIALEGFCGVNFNRKDFYN
jgi:hypothetical protein